MSLPLFRSLFHRLIEGGDANVTTRELIDVVRPRVMQWASSLTSPPWSVEWTRHDWASLIDPFIESDDDSDVHPYDRWVYQLFVLLVWTTVDSSYANRMWLGEIGLKRERLTQQLAAHLEQWRHGSGVVYPSLPHQREMAITPDEQTQLNRLEADRELQQVQSDPDFIIQPRLLSASHNTVPALIEHLLYQYFRL